jgi:hypothetical protein
MAKVGRPKKQIDRDAFEKLCALQCTQEEICGVLGVTDKTLQAWCKRTYKANFSEVFRQKRQLGKMSLRRSQFKLAEKNATMAIWLGKQYLDQRDRDIADAVERSNGVLESILALRNSAEQQ